jgi:hypothetical protein
MKRLLVILSILIPLTFALPALGFDIRLGIVGNLPYACRVEGNCGFCDFIDLFIILQKVILSLFGGLALIMIIWGGTAIMTSAGNSQKMAEGKKLIISTLFGVLIILAGYFLISVLVAILVTPARQAPNLTLFGADWRRAFCAQPLDAKLCTERGEGTTCTVTSGSHTGNGVCKGGVCITNCESQQGNNGYSCQINTACDQTTILPGLCPGPANYVCCKPPS